MNVNAKYLKDESNKVFSPITSVKSIFNEAGNDLSTQFINASINSDVTVNLPGAWQPSKIIFNSILTSIGTSFTLTNGNVIIGTGVKYARVSGNICIWTSPVTIETVFVISQKRDNLIIRQVSSDTAKLIEGGSLSLSISNSIFDIQDGDIFEMLLSSNIPGDFRLLGRGLNSFITFEKVL